MISSSTPTTNFQLVWELILTNLLFRIIILTICHSGIKRARRSAFFNNQKGDHAMKRSLEDLKARSEKALAYPDLIQIARYAPAPVRAYDDALALLREKSHDKEKIRDLARACRFLAIIRRDYDEDEFEKWIAENQENAGNKKENTEMEKEIIISEERIVLIEGMYRARIKSSSKDNLWGYKIDDVIIIDRDTLYLHQTLVGKKATVLGFLTNELNNNSLPYPVPSVICLVKETNSVRSVMSPLCISLLERKSLSSRCRVGEYIIIEDGECFREGNIKIIDPLTEKILVECRKYGIKDDFTRIEWKWFDAKYIEINLLPKLKK